MSMGSSLTTSGSGSDSGMVNFSGSWTAGASSFSASGASITAGVS